MVLGRQTGNEPWGTNRRCRAAILLGSLAVILQGCSNQEFMPSLAFPPPDKYEAATGASVRPAVSRWWARFGSPELNRLMDEADTENLDIKVAVAQLREAEAQINISGAPLWPQISFADDNVRSQSSGTLAHGVINKPQARNTLTRALSVSYIFDVWGQNRDALDAALRTAAASAYQVEVVRLITRAAVVDNYLTYAANWERVEVADQNLANARRVLQVIRQRKEAGTASDLDVSQQATLVETQRAAIPVLRQTAGSSRLALALLLGRPAQSLDLKRKNILKLDLPTVRPGLPSDLLFRRPDIRAAEEQLESASANVEVARKAFLPTIELTGDVGFQSALLSTLLRPESLIYSVAASLTQPIFQGGRLRGQLELTQAQRQALLETYRKSVVAALTDVERALIAIRETAAQELAQTAAVKAARQAFKLSEDRLGQGVIDVTQLLTTQNTLFQAEDALIQVRLARLQAVVSLFQAIGGDWVEPVTVISRYQPCDSGAIERRKDAGGDRCTL